MASFINQFAGIANAARALWAGNKPGGITSQSFPVQVRRIKQDIGKWRAALDRAEAVFYPDRTQLLNIYADVALDAHLTSVLTSRKINVLGKPFKLVDSVGKENPKLTKLLMRPWFRQACDAALDSKFYGHSLIEFDTPVDGQFHKVSLIERQYVFPEAGLVRTMPGMITGTDYRNDPQFAPWMLEIGGPRDLGLLLKAAPYVIWKKNVLSAWADFTEMFGMPYRAISGDFDGTQMAEVNKMMADMGQAAYGVFPAGAVVDFIAPSTGNDKVFNAFVDRSNSELSKLVLGQTMTTDSGSSRSQGEVHERVADAYTRDDATWLSEWLNEELLPFLLTHGYPLAGYEFKFDDTESLSKTEQFAIVSGIMEKSGYQVSRQYLVDTFGVELEAVVAAGGALGADGQPVGAVPEARPILGYHIEEGVVSKNEARAQLNLPAIDETEAERERALSGQLSIVTVAVAAGIPLAEALKLVGLVITLPPSVPPGKLVGQPSPTQPASLQPQPVAHLSLLVTAAAKNKLDKLAEGVIKRVHAGDLFAGTIDAPLYGYLRDHLEDAISIGWEATDPKLRAFLSENIQRFSGFKTHAVQQAMQEKLTDAEGKVRPFADFRADALEVSQLYNVDYLQTEYNTAVGSAQMASKWSEFSDGAMLTYRTVGDGLVRAEHAEYDGITLPKDDPFWDSFYPPCDYNCRCDVVETDADATPTAQDTLDSLPEPPEEFRNNSGKGGEVFNAEHPYFDVAKEVAAKIEEQL